MIKILIIFIFMTARLLTVQAIKMSCMFERITRVEKDVGEFKHIKCSVALKFEIKTRGIEIDEVLGVDLMKFPYPSNLTDVKELKISTRQVLFMPTEINKLFPLLKSLDIENCGLKEITQSDLKMLPELKVLNLHGNALEVVEKDLFKFNLKLFIINMDMNNLKHINAHVFDHLTELKSLNFAGNLCISLSLTGPNRIKEVIEVIERNCQNYGELGEKREIVFVGKQRGKYFWILVGCGIITGIFSLCALMRIAFGFIKGF